MSATEKLAKLREQLELLADSLSSLADNNDALAGRMPDDHARGYHEGIRDAYNIVTSRIRIVALSLEGRR
jgi:hypothetical protein